MKVYKTPPHKLSHIQGLILTKVLTTLSSDADCEEQFNLKKQKQKYTAGC
jgi:hypothetical protein